MKSEQAMEIIKAELLSVGVSPAHWCFEEKPARIRVALLSLGQWVWTEIPVKRSLKAEKIQAVIQQAVAQARDGVGVTSLAVDGNGRRCAATVDMFDGG